MRRRRDEEGQRRGGGRWFWVGLLAAAVFLLAALVGVIAWYEVEAHPSGRPGRAVVVRVVPGEGTAAFAGALEQRGVISDALAFRVSLLLHGSPSLEPGLYQLHRNDSFAAVRTVVDSGPNIFDVDVPAGYTLGELEATMGELPGKMAHDFAVDARRGVVRSPYATSLHPSLEGLLGTGVYEVLPNETARQLLSAMVDRFARQAEAAGLTPTDRGPGGLSPYQVATVASIAQKEGYYDRYMGDVARVIYNRLARGMPLDMTSTVLYALGQDGGTVTPADQSLPSPYNTYLNTGLTPTPICFSSPAALAAAASPPPGTWLYFTVVARTGKTLFADTYTQQLANEALGRSKGIG